MSFTDHLSQFCDEIVGGNSKKKEKYRVLQQLWLTHKIGTICLMNVWYLQIINSENVQEAARETDGYFIKSGIVTVIKDALIPSGTVIWEDCIMIQQTTISVSR